MPHDITKPTWPYTDVTLRAHMGAGQWYKTVKGQAKYFGVLADPATARRKYLAYLSSAEAPAEPVALRRDQVTMSVLVNSFLTRRLALFKSGDRSGGQFARYRRAGKTLLEHFGHTCIIASIQPAEMRQLKSKLTGGPVNVGNAIRDMRTIFNWGREHYDVAPRYGDEFDRPGKRAIRASQTPRKLWTAQEIRTLLLSASPALRCMILLGINCGFGQADCSQLTRQHFDLQHHHMPRGKTLINRLCPLWPRTVAALCDYSRPRPMPGLEHLFFVTRLGLAWVSETVHADVYGAPERANYKDNVSQQLRKLCVKCGVEYRPFYTFRHTFRSVADEVADSTAIDCIMGHSLGGMREVYTQLLGNGMARLSAVTKHVDLWLLS